MSDANEQVAQKLEQLAKDFEEEAEAHLWSAGKFEQKADNCKESARRVRKTIDEMKAL